MMTEEKKFAEWTYFIKESAIRELLKYNVKYYFGGGLPGALPLDVHSQILIDMGTKFQELLKQGKEDEVLAAYNYGQTAGLPELRQILMKRLVERQHLPFNPEEDWSKVMITSGSQQAIYAILDSLINPGDVILVPSPSYLGFVSVSDKLGAKTVGIPTDENGLIIDGIRKAIDISIKKFGKKPKLLYAVPTSDNPKGYTMDEKHRKQIYDLITEYDIYLFEDDAYKEIQFGKLYDPIKKYDKENTHVIYTSSTSKESGVFRIGYGIMPKEIMDNVEKDKGYLDLCTPTLTQKLVTEYYKGPIEKYLAKAITTYKGRMEAMLKGIQETFPEGIYTKPTGGFFIWWETENKNFDSTKFNFEVGIPNKVLYVQSEAFYAPRGYALNEDMSDIVSLTPKKNGMRLSFSKVPEQIIEEGIPLLGKLLTEHIK